jgi:hypothetical protein
MKLVKINLKVEKAALFCKVCSVKLLFYKQVCIITLHETSTDFYVIFLDCAFSNNSYSNGQRSEDFYFRTALHVSRHECTVRRSNISFTHNQISSSKITVTHAFARSSV